MKLISNILWLMVSVSFSWQSAAEAQTNDAQVNVFIGLEQSDNLPRSSGLVSDGQSEEIVYKGGLDFNVNSRSSAYQLSATGSVERRQYENGLFDDETIGRVVAGLDWILAEETLVWNFSANHGQQIVDPFQAITPGNREDVTIISTGPRLVLPIAARTFLEARISHWDARYEVRPLDNSRIEGNLSLERQITPTRNVSLNVGGSQVEYDEDQLLPKIDLLNASLGFDAESARNTWSIEVGWNYYERIQQEGDGFALDLSFRRALTESISLSFRAGSNYSMNGDIFRLDQELQLLTSSSQLIDEGTVDIQGFGDIFRHDYAIVVYSQSIGRTRVDLTGSWRVEEYEALTGLDRAATTAHINLSRELSQTLSTSVFGVFSNRDYASGGRADDDSSYGLSFTARLGRNFSLSLGARQLRRDSNSAEFDYDETRANLNISYAAL